VRFRTHKQVVRHIETESAAKVAHEVVRGSVVLAAAAAAWRHVEARVLAPYPGHQLRGHAIGNGKVRQPNAIEVIKKGRKGTVWPVPGITYSFWLPLQDSSAPTPKLCRIRKSRADARRQTASYGLRE